MGRVQSQSKACTSPVQVTSFDVPWLLSLCMSDYVDSLGLASFLAMQKSDQCHQINKFLFFQLQAKFDTLNRSGQ